MFHDRQFRIPRLWSNQQLKMLAPYFSGSVVNVSAGDDVDKQGMHYRDYFSNATQYHLTNYSPGAFRGYKERENEHLLDLTEEVPAELVRKFDVALSHTVLEHVYEVKTAFKNTCDLSKDVVIVVVPFAQVQHETSNFGDYWRFTPRSIQHMFRDNGLEVIYESWNNTRGASVYLISIGSRNPDKWAGKLPHSTPGQAPGNWIGNTKLYSLRKWYKCWK